ncbi:MAG: orotidine-5'-phosphate decarboxylase [Propionibacteriaceae bacterium]|nr:orotidine-5'-phosphate decarboxylase [Propionibacteriaceae bacterium]
MTTYFKRLRAVVLEKGPLCVAVDPHPSLLKAWGLPVSASGAEKCARHLVNVLSEQVAAFKPQSAFFEMYGSAGIAALERVLADINQTDAISILDVKRGDIGSTMEAYAAAYLAKDAPLAADAITISPYLGFGSLLPAIEAAYQNDRGVYVLARTSNPEGADVQLALNQDGSVVQNIIDAATEMNRDSANRAIGLVVGGTHRSLGCDLSDFNGSILVPGIGFQGGKMEDLPAIFGDAVEHVLAVVGRGLLSVGPDAQALRTKVSKLIG